MCYPQAQTSRAEKISQCGSAKSIPKDSRVKMSNFSREKEMFVAWDGKWLKYLQLITSFMTTVWGITFVSFFIGCPLKLYYT